MNDRPRKVLFQTVIPPFFCLNEFLYFQVSVFFKSSYLGARYAESVSLDNQSGAKTDDNLHVQVNNRSYFDLVVITEFHFIIDRDKKPMEDRALLCNWLILPESDNIYALKICCTFYQRCGIDMESCIAASSSVWVDCPNYVSIP